MSKLRDAAEGQECTIRVPGICNHRIETTVLAHYRMLPDCGTGIKPLDLIGAHACSACHDAVDGRMQTGYSRDALDLMHLQGMCRTIVRLFKQGKLKL